MKNPVSLHHLDPTATYCCLTDELCKESLCGPVRVVLALENRVVLYATELDNFPVGVYPITEADPCGVYLVSVPLEYVDFFMTTEEANMVFEIGDKLVAA
jgi:hypothetical protein